MMAVEDNQQWLNQIRDQVRAAFRGPDVRIPSIIADWITRESKDVDTRRRPPKGLSKEERREWYGTAWNREVQATESRNPGRSKPLIYEFPDGWILRRMAQLKPEHRRILKLLYKPSEPRKPHEEWLKWHLWGQYELDGLQNKTKALIALMIERQLEQFGNAYGWRGLMSQPHELFEVDKDAWRQTYRQHWENISGILISLDESALWAICE